MDQINFLLWATKIASLSDEKWNLRTNAIVQGSKIIENEINSSGGIFGKPAKLICKFFDSRDFGYEQLIKFFLENPQIHVNCGSAANASRNDQILSNVDINNILYFNFADSKFANHKNYFNISQTIRESKIETAKHFLKNTDMNKKIFFFHEGIRYKNELLPFMKKNKINFTDFDLSKISDKNFDSYFFNLITKINDKHFLVLDLKPSYLLKMFNFFNENKKYPTILKLYGLIDGRINNYNFPMIEAANQRTGHSLSFQRFCDLINPNYSIDDKDFLFSSMYRLEIPLLVSYVSKTIQNSVNDRKTFISSIRNGINKIDGINDIFIGKSLNYSFLNNKNISRLSYNYLMPQSLQKNGSIQRIFHPIQFFPRMGKIKKFDVNYAYIDIIRITQVDIGQSIWSCEFFLDIISKHKKPLEIINFNNLSLLNSKFETKLVKQTKDQQFGGINYRYYIVANFDFFAIADNYPFDWQHIYISMSISDQDKFGLLQPIPEALLDKEFQLDGWRLEDAKTGVLRKKEMHHQNANLEQVVEVREEIRVGWTIARTNVVTTMKVVIPIIFLMFLNYYTFFLPFDSVSTSIGILTTTFLSGIALYFSTEKPQPLRITTIDLIFIYYYLQVGLSVIVTAVTGFTNEILFNYSMVAMKFILPLSILTALFLLFYRIKSVRLRPRIDA